MVSVPFDQAVMAVGVGSAVGRAKAQYVFVVGCFLPLPFLPRRLLRVGVGVVFGFVEAAVGYEGQHCAMV